MASSACINLEFCVYRYAGPPCALLLSVPPFALMQKVEPKNQGCRKKAKNEIARLKKNKLRRLNKAGHWCDLPADGKARRQDHLFFFLTPFDLIFLTPFF